MNYKAKLIEIFTTPEGKNFLTEEQSRIVAKISDGIDYAWNNWDDEIVKAHYEGNTKPVDAPASFIQEWIENEDFSADNYDVEGLKEIFK